MDDSNEYYIVIQISVQCQDITQQYDVFLYETKYIWSPLNALKIYFKFLVVQALTQDNFKTLILDFLLAGPSFCKEGVLN